MKKIAFFIIGILLLFQAPIFADTSKECNFAWSVLQSLHFCQWAMDYALKEGDDLATMMSDSITANNKLRDAKSAIEHYVTDKDENISMVAKGMIMGIDILIDGNNKLIEKMRKASNLDPEGYNDIEYDLAQIRSQNKQGWETLSLSSAWLLPVLIEPAKNENPTGQLPFKISKEERKMLLTRTNELFEDRLKKYDEYKALQKQEQAG